MAEDLKLRQRATQELIAQSREALEAIPAEERAILETISREFEAELDAQGVPLYAEEAFAVLTFIEGLDAESAESIEDLREFVSAVRLSMTLKIQTAWDRRDKGFFTD